VRHRVIESVLVAQPRHPVPWNESVMRDVRKIGHYGLGDTEYSLREPRQLETVKGLIKQAYIRTR
jgi:predicted transport protein